MFALHSCSPSALVGAEDSTNNNQSTPVVPITPIEDEDALVDTSSYASASTQSNITPMISQQQYSPRISATPKASVSGTEPDIIAAAQAALSAVMPSNQGNLIDRELLMKILSDPKMIEQLIANHAASPTAQNVASPSTYHGMTKAVTSSSSPGIPSTSAQYIPNSVSTPKSSFDSANIAIHRREPLPGRVTRPEMVAHSSLPAASGPYRTGSSIPHLRPSLPDAISAPSPSVPKVMNYYKSLIQQHGGERREATPQFAHQSQEPPNNAMMRPRDAKPRIMKPCIYFNSARGCRNGANCTFQHDAASQQRVSSMQDVQGAKRMKMDREMTGA